MRTETALLATLLLLLSLSTGLAQETPSYNVSVSATPPDCVLGLTGSGSYRQGSRATIEARVSPECRFVKWVFRGGGLPEEVAANPFTFYVFDDVEATAILEKLYRDNGTVIERVYIAFSANITSKALNLPRPKIVRPGERVDIYAQTEVLDGEYKYVFLYWSGPDGLRIDRASASITVNKSMTLVANYYVFRKFLDEYYPLHVFVKTSYPDVELPDGTVQRAVAIRVQGYNITLAIQPVPEPLLNLVEPVYERYIPYIITVSSPEEVVLTVNGKPLEVGSSVRLMDREGKAVVIEAPSEAGNVRLKKVMLGNMPQKPLGSGSEVIAFPLSKPIEVELIYTTIPHAFLREIPVVGALAYTLTETGYSILGAILGTTLYSDVEEIPFPIALATPLALIIGSGGGLAYAARIISRRGVRASIAAAGRGSIRGVRSRIASLMEKNEAEPDILPIKTELPYESRFTASPELVKMLEEAEPVEAVEGAEAEEEEEPVFDTDFMEKLEELVRVVEEGGRGTFPSSLLQLTRFTETYLDAVQTNRVRLEIDTTPLIYREEITKLVRKILATPSGVITVSGGDRLLRERVVEKALERAGRKWVKAGGLILPPEPTAIAQTLKKTAKGADTLILRDVAPSKALAQAAITSKLLIISILERGGEIELPPIPDDALPGVTASILAERELIKRIDHIQFNALVTLARIFRGAETVMAFADLLEEGLPPEEALDTLWTIEFKATFPSFEYHVAKQILEKGLTYGEARDLYITAYKQVTAGGDPQASWRRFLTKLEKLGVKVSA